MSFENDITQIKTLVEQEGPIFIPGKPDDKKNRPILPEKDLILDIDVIPEGLYIEILKEFRRQFGDGYYGNWVLKADREDPKDME